MRFGHFLPTTFFMCVFPKVLILIMFMVGGGGQGGPQKCFALRQKTEPREFSILQNPKYAPVSKHKLIYEIQLIA